MEKDDVLILGAVAVLGYLGFNRIKEAIQGITGGSSIISSVSTVGDTISDYSNAVSEWHNSLDTDKDGTVETNEIVAPVAESATRYSIVKAPSFIANTISRQLTGFSTSQLGTITDISAGIGQGVADALPTNRYSTIFSKTFGAMPEFVDSLPSAILGAITGNKISSSTGSKRVYTVKRSDGSTTQQASTDVSPMAQAGNTGSNPKSIKYDVKAKSVTTEKIHRTSNAGIKYDVKVRSVRS